LHAHGEALAGFPVCNNQTKKQRGCGVCWGGVFLVPSPNALARSRCAKKGDSFFKKKKGPVSNHTRWEFSFSSPGQASKRCAATLPCGRLWFWQPEEELSFSRRSKLSERPLNKQSRPQKKQKPMKRVESSFAPSVNNQTLKTRGNPITKLFFFFQEPHARRPPFGVAHGHAAPKKEFGVGLVAVFKERGISWFHFSCMQSSSPRQHKFNTTIPG